MGIEHVNWLPSYNSGEPFNKQTYHIGDTKEMSNNDLLWQIRVCKEPGKVDVIAAFKECEDAIAFMTVLHKNKGHGFVGKKMTIGFGNKDANYSIEHNSSSEFVEMTYKTKKDKLDDEKRTV